MTQLKSVLYKTNAVLVEERVSKAIALNILPAADQKYNDDEKGFIFFEARKERDGQFEVVYAKEKLIKDYNGKRKLRKTFCAHFQSKQLNVC